MPLSFSVNCIVCSLFLFSLLNRSQSTLSSTQPMFVLINIFMAPLMTPLESTSLLPQSKTDQNIYTPIANQQNILKPDNKNDSLFTKMKSNKDKTDFQILVSILREYVIGESEIRRLVFPSLTAFILSKMFYVKASAYLMDITKSLISSTFRYKMVFYYGMCLFANVVISNLGYFYISKARHVGYQIANKKAYEYFLCLQPEDFKAIPKGEMQNIIQRKAEAVKDILDVLTMHFLPFLITMTVACSNIILTLGVVATFIVVFAVCVYIVATIQITIWRNNIRIQLNETQDNSQNVLNDGLSNYETIFAYGTEEYETRRYDGYLTPATKKESLLSRTLYLLNLVQGCVWAGQIFFTILFLCIFKRGMLAEELSYTVSILGIFHSSLDNLGFMYGKYKTGMINIRRTNLKTRTKKQTAKKLFRIKERVGVYDMSYGYDTRLILDRVNFSLNKGDKIAVVGENGTGKSTLLKSLMRFNTSDAQIFCDQFKREDLSEQNYKELFAYVPQSASLFNETVLYNIKYGTNVYDEQVYKAAIQLGLHESIERLGNKYQTVCGENGGAISGGERQKIAVIRAYLKNASVWLLDEPTASMDRVSERAILEKLLQPSDRIVVAIVHNHDLLRLFDKILLVENKQVYEMTYDEFIRRK
ncbi:hypothetical protein ECANGB1_2769 [Enterospora canceri]|uniref:Uncharacterized protein n=1 Tax=Enterospora canceri TaxID=1081671 RepID=A0A1Y1S9N4_9MICR|nr:hypothetical protein ECANGB1_2769 [Enterospora canceri]